MHDLPPAGGAPAGTDSIGRALQHPGVSHFIGDSPRRVHYLMWGDRSEQKPVLILVHGYRGHAHWWDAIAPFFTDWFRVIAVDLPGMGDSDFWPDYRGYSLAENIIAVAEHECSSPAIVAAHSFGGSRLLVACLQRPELFARAIIIDSHIQLEDDPLPPEPLVRPRRVYPDLPSGMARFRLMPQQPAGLPELMEHVARHSLRQVEGGWEWKFDPALPSVHLLISVKNKDLKSLTTPMDFIYGEHSLVVDEQRALRTVNALGAKRRPIMIPDGHHHLMLDQPVALIAALRALLA